MLTITKSAESREIPALSFINLTNIAMIIENDGQFNSDIPEIKKYIFNKKTSAQLMELIAIIRTEKGLSNNRPLVSIYEMVDDVITNG